MLAKILLKSLVTEYVTEVHEVCTSVMAFYHIYICMVGVAYLLWVFSMANLKQKDNLKLC